MRFGKNNVLCPKYIDIYEFQGLWGGRTWSNIHLLFIIFKKTQKIKEHDLYLNQILHHFDIKKDFLG